MDRMIYLSMAGAKAAMNRQEVLSHNLANVNTTGFREEMAAMRAVPVRGDGASTRVYSLETTVGYKPDAGPVTQTNRNLDVAMQDYLEKRDYERNNINFLNTAARGLQPPVSQTTSTGSAPVQQFQPSPLAQIASIGAGTGALLKGLQ